MLAAGGMGGWGGACRAATGNEWARAMIALAAMQGLGKPGSNIWSTTSGVPFDKSGSSSPATPRAASPATSPTRRPGSAWPTACGPTEAHSPTSQHSPEGQTVPRLRIPEAMLHERLEWRGKGFCGLVHRVAVPRVPLPGRPAIPHVRMYYRYGGSFIGTMTETNRYVKAYREGKVPFVVNQAVWIEGETKFADVILPACTNFERWDIGDWAYASGYGTHKFDQATIA